MRKLGAALAVGVLLVATACGSGGGDDRPSVGDVSKALRKAGDGSLLGTAASKLDEKAADCVAKVLVDSEISDEGLQAIIDGDADYKASEADEAAVASIASKMVGCVPSSP